MTFRTRLLIAFALTVVVAVAFVGAIVSTTTRRLSSARRAACVGPCRAIPPGVPPAAARDRPACQDIAEAEATREMVIALSRPDADPAAYVDAAQPLAAAHKLDFLELVSARQHRLVRTMARALPVSGRLGHAARRTGIRASLS